MALSEAQKRAHENYKKRKCDPVTFTVPKGKRAAYKLMADELGLSLARLFQYGAEEFAQNHSDGNIRALLELKEFSLTGRERALLARFKCLPERAQTNFIRLMGDLARQLGAQVDEDEAEGIE